MNLYVESQCFLSPSPFNRKIKDIKNLFQLCLWGRGRGGNSLDSFFGGGLKIVTQLDMNPKKWLRFSAEKGITLLWKEAFQTRKNMRVSLTNRIINNFGDLSFTNLRHIFID